MFRNIVVLLSIWLCVLGCDQSASEAPPGADQIFVRPPLPFENPTLFLGRPGGTVGPLTVQVLGPEIHGIPGRNGRRDPVEGVEVEFQFDFTLGQNELLDAIPDELLPREPKGPAESSAGNGEASRPSQVDEKPPSPGGQQQPRVFPEFEAYKPYEIKYKEELEPPEVKTAYVKTDRDGYARINVKLGRFVGEYRVKAEIRNQFDQGRNVEFWLYSGAELIAQQATEREGPVGTAIDVALKIFSCNGANVVPEDDRAVIFSVVQDRRQAGGATLERDRQKRTNSEGTAKVSLELGERSGTYHVLADLEPTKESPAFRGVVIDQYALDWMEVGSSLLGGLALFLIGLRFLSSGLVVQMGRAIDRTTASKNRAVGFLGGTLIGASFQSSSALITRLMVFANGGLLLTSDVVGHLLGANLGRTVLPQILSFGPISSLAVPLLLAGVLLYMLPVRGGSRRWGSILVGGGALILGWQFLEETANLAHASPTLTALLRAWDPASGGSPFSTQVAVFAIDAIFALVLAFLLQSSNLVVVAGIALASCGLVSPHMVITLVVGANVGSSLSIFVRSLSRSRESRRLALTNTLFLLFGSSWLLLATLIPIHGKPPLLLLTEWVTPGRFFHPQPENVALHMAVLYSLFHLLNGLLLLPLAPWFLRLSAKIIPRDAVNDNVKPYHLDPNLLDVPSLAVTQATREVIYLLEIVRKSIAESFDSFRYQDLNLSEQIARREESIDTVQRDISRFLLRVSQNSLSLPLASRVQCLQAAVGNLARIGQQGVFLRDLATVAVEERAQIPEDILRDLTEVYDLMITLFDNVLHLLEQPNRRVEENAVKLGERLARSASRIENTWIERARSSEGKEGADDATTPVVFIVCRDVYTAIALVARHLAHVAERMRLLSGD